MTDDSPKLATKVADKLRALVEDLERTLRHRYTVKIVQRPQFFCRQCGEAVVISAVILGKRLPSRTVRIIAGRYGRLSKSSLGDLTRKDFAQLGDPHEVSALDFCVATEIASGGKPVCSCGIRDVAN